MSTVKISELTALTSADAADELVIVDDSAGVTKKITAANLNASFDVSALDDYDEGTWTPAYDFPSGSVTHDIQVGHYVKLGNVVVVSARINTSSISSPSGDATIVGLPFTPNGITHGCSFRLIRNFSTNMTYFYGGLFDGNPAIALHKNATGANVDGVEGSDFASGGSGNELQFSIAYLVD